MIVCRDRHRRSARLAGVPALSLWLLLLAGCASTPTLDDAARAQLPLRAELAEVPFHGQRDYQCGPASLAMALNASGVDITRDDLIPQVFLPGRDGSVQPEMLAAARRQGRLPFVIDASFEALLTELAAGRPVVVLQNLSLPAWPLWHYAVAIGYDRRSGELILHSGTTPRQHVDFGRFDATWARSGRWAFVTLPPGELPQAISASQAMESVAAYERVQGTAATRPSWEAVVERFPSHALGHFALGNARHAAGDIDSAMVAFEMAVARDPSLTPAWLNLGILHRDLGEFQAARAALERAVADEGPWRKRARHALRSLPQGDAT